MGAALNSLAILLGYAGTSAVVALVLILFWRMRTEKSKRNFIQRMPLLTPAIVFLIATLAVYNYVPLPINQFSQENTLYLQSHANYTESFTVQPFGSVYTDQIEISVSRYMNPGEYVHAEFRFYQDTTLVRTRNIDLNASETPDVIETDYLVALDPGAYTVQVNTSFYDNDVPEEGVFTAYITQHMQNSVAELLNWSNYQFFLNVFTVVLIFSGLCIATEGPDRTGQYGKKPETELRTYDDQES
jgi:hypothetical protein